MLVLFAAHGDPSFPFLLGFYAQVTLFHRLPDSLAKAEASAPSRNSLCSSLDSELQLMRCLLSFFVGGVGQDKPEEDHMELPSSIQCSVKLKIGESDPTLMNILDYQVLPLGQQYRMAGWDPDPCKSKYRGVAFLPLNKEGRGGEFVVLLNYSNTLLVLKSAEMRWMRLERASDSSCKSLVAFRGRFYATFLGGDVLVFDPYSLIPTPLMPSPPLRSSKFLFTTGDDELFLVEKFNPFPEAEVLDFRRFTCRVSLLDEKAGEWVVVTDLGDRLFFSGQFGNVCCSAKELPEGCGLSGNSIVFTNHGGDVTYAYRYGVRTGREEDDLNCWRYFRENRVTIISTTYSVLALRVER